MRAFGHNNATFIVNRFLLFAINQKQQAGNALPRPVVFGCLFGFVQRSWLYDDAGLPLVPFRLDLDLPFSPTWKTLSKRRTIS